MSYKFIDEKGEHLHTLNGQPLLGASTVLGIVAKQLTWWAAGMAIKEFGWNNPKDTSPEDRLQNAQIALESVKTLTPDEYLAKLDKAYRAHDSFKNKAATKGTDLHSELEKFVKHCIDSNEGRPLVNDSYPEQVKKFALWAIENVEKFLWSEACCYSETLWVGGICDAGAKMIDGHTAVIDFKSAKEVYMTHILQCAGYAQLISESGILTKNGDKIQEVPTIDALTVFPFGGGQPKTVYAVEDYQRAFVGATLLYSLNKTYDK